MKYKVGNKVKIKSLEWYNTHKNAYGNIVNTRPFFASYMSKYCGKEATIIDIDKYFHNCYKLDIDQGMFTWSEYALEENFKNMETKKIVIPKGWEVEKVENGEIILKESEEKFPKTWEECYKVLDYGESIENDSSIARLSLHNPINSNKNAIPVGLGKPMLALMQLLICRDAYRKRWQPDWCSIDGKHCIECYDGGVRYSEYKHTHRVLSFQSQEICMEFLENFRDLIEEAKELI